MTVSLDYDPEAFDAATVESLGAGLRTLLTRIAADPGRRPADLPVLGPADGRRLLDRLAGPVTSPPRRTLADAFAAQAARTPYAPAVTAGAEHLTYRQLDERANRLARLLIEAGAGPERFVALALPRTADLIVALLAVLKSGAAYLPLDPGHPAERVAFLLDDVRPDAVITCAETSARLPDGPCPRIVLDDAACAARLAAASAAPVTDGERRGALVPDHPAYVIHTAG
ncbi:AMP-binding protein, partial [Streptomyces prasinus]|uniref:AMP-binding protein n=1 Tax=Streptomyces prasinus TaxID=67345 RepID=UPI00363F9266